MNWLSLIANHSKEISGAIFVLSLFFLWFIVERQGDYIKSQRTEICRLEAEINKANENQQELREDFKAVRHYIESLGLLESTEKKEIEKNEQVCKNADDLDSVVPRINELFGFCSEDK